MLPAPPAARQRKLIYGRGGPQAPRFHMRPQGWVTTLGCRMMELPLGFRVSGPIGPLARGVLLNVKYGPKGPNFTSKSSSFYYRKGVRVITHTRIIMRRDYVVVPPNRRACTHTRAQPMERHACPGLKLRIKIMKLLKN